MIVKIAFGAVAGQVNRPDPQVGIAPLLIAQGNKGKIHKGVVEKSPMAGKKFISNPHPALGAIFRGAKNDQPGSALIDIVGPAQYLNLWRPGIYHDLLF